MEPSSFSTASASGSRPDPSPRSCARQARARAQSSNVTSALDRPTPGTVARGDTDPAQLSKRRLTILRRQRNGLVFQAFNPPPAITVAQNITMPLRPDGSVCAARSCARSPAGRAAEAPGQPSLAALRGQQQRLAIAQALLTRPEVAQGTAKLLAAVGPGCKLQRSQQSGAMASRRRATAVQPPKSGVLLPGRSSTLISPRYGAGHCRCDRI